MKNLLKTVVIAAAVTAGPAFANDAAALDISAATGILGGLTAAIVSIQSLKLAPAATSMAFKWVKGAIFS